MTVDELYDYITHYMTPEEALKKLLATQIQSYEKLKLQEGEANSPYFIICAAAFDLNWSLSIENNKEVIRGIMVGTDEYLNEFINTKTP